MLTEQVMLDSGMFHIIVTFGAEDVEFRNVSLETLVSLETEDTMFYLGMFYFIFWEPLELKTPC